MKQVNEFAYLGRIVSEDDDDDTPTVEANTKKGVKWPNGVFPQGDRQIHLSLWGRNLGTDLATICQLQQLKFKQQDTDCTLRS